MMKKYLILFLLLCCSFESYAIDLDGKYQSLSGELLFRFSGDSLYIDIAQSHRNISAFKLVKRRDTEKMAAYNAFETYQSNGKATYREVLIRVTNIEDDLFLLEYYGKDKDRDYNSNERYTIRKTD